jgi:myo-inositol-1-phosphate synthase
MQSRRVGLWLVGALGGVGTTVALGLAALKRGLAGSTGLTTALPGFDRLDLDPAAAFEVGGHDIRRGDFLQTVREFQQRSRIFPPELVEPCREELARWSANVRPGTIHNSGAAVCRLADLPEVARPEHPRAAVERIQQDLAAFRSSHRLDQVVVVNVASTEPPFEVHEAHQDLARLEAACRGKDHSPLLPASSLYALAALDLGCPYVNFTPSLGASFPAAIELAHQRRTVVAGQDGKTGETLLKTVLAPLFLRRNFRVLSWVGHNIFGNRDGLILDDPRHKASKVRTKDQVVGSILGYSPQTHVSIEYIESLDDWKTAWDHIHFEGFLGVRMILQFTWQGCDSVLAAPLVIDLARLALHAQRRGEVGVLRYLACFWKNPMGVAEHDFFRQWAMLEQYLAEAAQDQPKEAAAAP